MNQSIHFDTMQNIFHLNTKNSSYIIKILKDGTLSHIYYGKRLRRYHGSKPFIFVDRGFSPNPTLEDSTFSYDTIPQEYPTNGDGIFVQQLIRRLKETDREYRDFILIPMK